MHNRSFVLVALCLCMLTGCRQNAAEQQLQTEPTNGVTAETTIVLPKIELERDIPEETAATQSTTASETAVEEVQEQEEHCAETEETIPEEIIREDVNIPDIIPDDTETHIPMPGGENELRERDLD